MQAVNVVECTINEYNVHHSYNGKPSFIGQSYSDPDLQFRYWHKQGRLHRLDAPAMEYKDGSNYWFLNGKEALKTRQKIIIASSIEINNEIGIVLRHVEGCFYQALFGNKKELIVRI